MNNQIKIEYNGMNCILTDADEQFNTIKDLTLKRMEKSRRLNEIFYLQALREEGKDFQGEKIPETIKYSNNSRLAQYPKLEKTIDYSFVGQVQCYWDASRILPMRHWILEYIEKFFTKDSFLQFTINKGSRMSKKNKKVLSKFKNKAYNKSSRPIFKKIDKSPEKLNTYFGPDEKYLEVLASSKFSLCPGGDAPWSIRFYESIALGAIPILKDKKEAFYSNNTSGPNYKFYLNTEKPKYKKSWAKHNLELFQQEHLV